MAKEETSLLNMSKRKVRITLEVPKRICSYKTNSSGEAHQIQIFCELPYQYLQ